MLCENCGKREARVHYTQITNDKRVEVFLCEECASTKSGFCTAPDLSSMLSGIMGLHSPYNRKNTAVTACPVCGMSSEEFNNTGKMGCINCYAMYADRIKPLIKRIHGNNVHIGKVPQKVAEGLKATREADSLKKQLDAAVREERYEDAAKIRDRIKLMGNGKQKTENR